MNEHYSYDEIYGTLLYKNETDDIRKYFVIDCEYYKFYRLMFMYGWNKVSIKQCERKGLRGFEVKLHRKLGD
jgi:hypothetical protein